MNNKNEQPNRLSFYLILFILPFLLLAIIEAALRLTGFGNSYPLFIEAEALDGYMQPNPDLIKRYFPDPERAPDISPDTTYFRSEKSADTFRIVVQGGSSAAGFPYGRFGSLSGMLKQRFKRQYPDKDIEIINTAMSAVNSYTLLDLSDEIIAIDPDLILIYAGHNEFLGIMGVGSVFGSDASRPMKLLFLSLQDLRLMQLMQRLILLFKEEPDSAGSSDRTLMAMVAAGQLIAYESDTYEAGISQFSENLEAMLGRYQKADIPVVLGNLISNEKDQRPFESTEADEVFQQANQNRLRGEFDLARDQYQTARDYDQLRFRAPNRFNEIISSKVQSPDVFLADVDSMVRADSIYNIIGFEHMLEHLHPNKRGYFLLAEAFAETIATNRLIDDLSAQSIPLSKAWLDIPLTKVDELVADQKIRQLTSGYPFNKTPQRQSSEAASEFDMSIASERFAGGDWLNSMQKMLTAYQRQQRFDEAAKVAGLMFEALPNQHQIAYIAGQLYYRNTDHRMALYYHTRAVQLNPDNVDYILMAARSNYANRRLEKSIELLESAVRLAPANQQAKFQLQRIKAEQANGN